MGVIKRQGIKNAIINYIGVVIGAISIVFIQPKLLSEEELGLTRLLYDFSYMIGLLVPIGLPNIIVKYFPSFKDKEKGHNGFATIILGVFFVGFIISACLLLGFKSTIISFYSDTKGSELFTKYFIFVVPFTFIVSAITVTTAYCQSLFKSTIPSFLNDVCIRVGVILIIILYSKKIISFDQFVYAYIGLYAIELIVIMVYLFIIDKVSFKLNKEILNTYSFKSMMRFGLLLCMASLASIAIRKIDGFILGSYSLGLVGVYTTAVFIAAFIEVPLGALDRISHTKIADSFAKNNLGEIEKIYTDSVKYLLVIGGLLFVGICTCTGYLYEVAKLPESFVECVDVVYIVSFGALVNISTGVNSAIMFYSSSYLLGTLLQVSTLIVTVVLNVFLIKDYGIYGAAIASLAGAFISNLIKYLFIYKKFGFQPYSGKSFLVFVLIVICTLIGYVLPDAGNLALINLLYKGAVVSALYILSVYWLKIIPEIFENILSRIKTKR